uniref:Uncharacterized protein n=1 Tax=viral metagenome TaxID=1070528 RepID=A0A6C0K5I4_9ZZZZ
MSEREAAPLFLTEAQLQAQGKVVNWRNGLKDISGSLFGTPHSMKEIPSIFQKTTNNSTPKKLLPFSYRGAGFKLNAGHSKPKFINIIVPISTEDDTPPYLPKTP